tara:strand:+ start:7460 stop:8509 length:1050 start_codon:yes stop_codon:yes gene_type:complete
VEEAFKRLLIRPEMSIYNALQVINNNEFQLALVTNGNNSLLGTITDGDIRRAILRGHKIEDSVEKIMNKKYHFIRTDQSREKAFELMRVAGVNQIPVLDKDSKLINLIVKNNSLNKEKKDNYILIMAGGKGKRLMPYTRECPKPMIKVSGKPMLEIILEQCIESGFKKFYFSVNYLKEQIMNYFDDGSKWGISIEYLIENQPLGTAGCLTYINKEISKPLIVINGDILTNFNLHNILSFHNESESQATIGAREYTVNIPFGILSVKDHELQNVLEKPTYKYLVNAGIYVINPNHVKEVKAEEYLDMTDFLINLKKQGAKIGVCPIHEYWIDVGIPEALSKANKDWEGQK